MTVQATAQVLAEQLVAHLDTGLLRYADGTDWSPEDRIHVAEQVIGGKAQPDELLLMKQLASGEAAELKIARYVEAIGEQAEWLDSEGRKRLGVTLATLGGVALATLGGAVQS